MTEAEETKLWEAFEAALGELMALGISKLSAEVGPKVAAEISAGRGVATVLFRNGIEFKFTAYDAGSRCVLGFELVGPPHRLKLVEAGKANMEN